MAAYDWLSDRAATIELDVTTDAAGNLWLHWEPGDGPRIVVGSHLDTVPHGGRFDGALGVLGGLQAVRILKHAGHRPRFPISIVAFMDEEGTRFGTALFGSRAFVGDDVSDLHGRADAAGTSLADAMAACGYSFEQLPHANAVANVATYLELHIEQGPVLEHEAVDIGVVSSIVGLVGLEVHLLGEANHAGTTPMGLRHDALAGAARIVCELREVARRTPGTTSNVGTISVEPGGKNVIPGSCTFSVDVRAPTADVLEELDKAVRRILEAVARDEGLRVEVSELYRLEPVELDADVSDAIERATDIFGASRMRLPSGAGHDAMTLGRHVPSAMLFVPSCDGVSHSPKEYTSPAQCEAGAQVLAHTLRLITS
jgi:hydantoinase/carbamoylase family amidase